MLVALLNCVRPILLVEDDEDIRDLHGSVLRRQGYTVQEAENGEQALKQLEETSVQPCLVLLDMMMPVMSGPEFLKVVQGSKRFSGLPIVVLSASGKPSDVSGVKRFVSKPIEPDLLLTVVRECCGPD